MQRNAGINGKTRRSNFHGEQLEKRMSERAEKGIRDSLAKAATRDYGLLGQRGTSLEFCPYVPRRAPRRAADIRWGLFKQALTPEMETKGY